MKPLSIEEKYRRSTRVILVFLIALTLFAWGYLIWQNGKMGGAMTMDMGTDSAQMREDMASRSLSALTSVSVPSFGMFVPMWVIMCIAMMLPTAIPMVLAMHKVCAKKAGTDQTKKSAYGPVAMFVLAYALIWTLFGIVCWAIAFLGFSLIGSWLNNWKHLLLSAGLLILLCGVYQLSPLKNACLTGCQHPLMFVAKHWKPGNYGAFLMGLRHGGECIGCCVALMVVMFPLGMMNVVWMGLFTILMYEEKNAKIGTALSKILGWILTAAGGIMTVAGIAVLIFVS